MNIYGLSAADLEPFPNLSISQADSLKIEGEDSCGPYRVWLSRCTVADGEPYDNKVTVERLVDGAWTLDQEYPG